MLQIKTMKEKLEQSSQIYVILQDKITYIMRPVEHDSRSFKQYTLPKFRQSFKMYKTYASKLSIHFVVHRTSTEQFLVS
jgi:hypothetical protein